MSGSYDQWRLFDLWATVADENDTNTTAHLQAWEQKYTLLIEQKAKLEALTAELSADWSPDKSEAAGTFVAQLTAITSLMDTASKSTAQIWAGVGYITDSLREAKAKLEPLKNDYFNKVAAAEAFNKQALPMLPDALIPSTALIPGLDSLIMKQHQDRLDAQARAIMSESDQAVSEAAPMIGKIVFPVMGSIDKGPIYQPAMSPSGTHNAGANGRPYVAPPVFTPPPPSVGQDQTINGGAPLVPTDGGPVLAGGPTQILSPHPGTVGATSPGMPIGSWPGNGSAPTIGAADGWLARTGTGESVLRAGGVIGEVGVHGFTAPRSSMPVGGVLSGDRISPTGARPTGTAPIGATGTAARGMGPRGSAVGRQVMRGAGQSEHGSANSKRSGRSGPDETGHSQTSGGGWRDHAYEQYSERRRDHRPSDPDDPWEVEQGVAPVLEAPLQPKDHDAGPGVIGLDR